MTPNKPANWKRETSKLNASAINTVDNSEIPAKAMMFSIEKIETNPANVIVAIHAM